MLKEQRRANDLAARLQSQQEVLKAKDRLIQHQRQTIQSVNAEKLSLKSEHCKRVDELTSQLRELEELKKRLIQKLEQTIQSVNAEELSLKSEHCKRVDELTSQLRELEESKKRFIQKNEQKIQAVNAENLRLMRELEERMTRICQLTSERDSAISEIQRNLNSLTASQSETPDWILNRNEISISKNSLGKGAYGYVKSGKFRGASVAVKQLHETILSPYNRRVFEREMTIAAQCRHPSLLQLIGATNDDGIPLIVTEILETDLCKILDDGALQESQILSICLDISCALNYLHMMQPDPIVHRDLSSRNVLLWYQKDALRAKLSDFGSANFLRRMMTKNPGNPLYSAPEASTYKQTPKVSSEIIFTNILTGLS